MEQDTYIKDRLDHQIEWYDNKSIRNQTWFRRLQIISILASGMIPFVTGYITDTTIALKAIVGLLGVLVSVITATLGLYRFQENWLEYRTTSESLKHEKILFTTRSGPYELEEPFKILVQRVEHLISKENSNWFHKMGKTNKPEDN